MVDRETTSAHLSDHSVRTADPRAFYSKVSDRMVRYISIAVLSLSFLFSIVVAGGSSNQDQEPTMSASGPASVFVADRRW